MTRRAQIDAPPEADRFKDYPHPRATYDLFGHGQAEQGLLQAYRDGRLPQSIILGGPEGIGKATLAWRLARFLMVNSDPNRPSVAAAQNLYVSPDHLLAHRLLGLAHGDLVLLRREWNDKRKRPFSEIRIEDIRKALGLFQTASGEGGWRILIIDCAEDLNRSGANALLKLIEEPPPKSLFLIISHKPGRILPTIRSRSHMLHLEPLHESEVAQALAALDEVKENYQPAAIKEAVHHSSGSVREALRNLDPDARALASKIDHVLGRLPELDHRGLHGLCEGLTGIANTEEFEAFLLHVYDWIDARVQAGAGHLPASQLARYAQVWEKIAIAARETEALNLDRRPLILSIFTNLAEASRD